MKHFGVSGEPVSRETQERLTIFATLLCAWNRSINLVARGDDPAIATRHVEDSLQLRRYLPSNVSAAVDLGSGAGFPGLVLAIACDVQFVLVESDRRKAAFLQEAIRETGASALVVAKRLEKVTLPPSSLITARAFAPLPRLLSLAEHLISPATVLLLLKGKDVEHELTDAAVAWKMDVERIQSVTDPGGTILRLTEVARA